MAPQTQNKPPTRDERLGREPDQIYVMGSPKSRAELRNPQPQSGDDINNLLHEREIRAMLSQAKQGGLEGLKAKKRLVTTGYKVAKMLSSKNSRLSNSTIFLMIGTALFFDVIELTTTWAGIGILGSYVTWIFGNLTFWTWFTTIHVPIGFSSPKKLLAAIVANVIEIIPALDAIPLLGMGWTIGVILIVVLTRLEDKTGIKLPTSPKKSIPDTIK